jgi:hypothetical protein
VSVKPAASFRSTTARSLPGAGLRVLETKLRCNEYSPSRVRRYARRHAAIRTARGRGELGLGSPRPCVLYHGDTKGNLAELEHARLRWKLVASHVAEASPRCVADRRAMLITEWLGRVGGVPIDERQRCAASPVDRTVVARTGDSRWESFVARLGVRGKGRTANSGEQVVSRCALHHEASELRTPRKFRDGGLAAV